jgi:phosphonate C-P lyase system protein PhnG
MDFREIMAEGDLEALLALAQSIADKYEVKVMRRPETCTAMLQAVDSVGETPFCVGEVLMTEAAVAISGVTGYGFALEDEPQRALCGAIIDAALRAGLAETAAIRAALEAETAKLRARDAKEAGLVAATTVNFAIMEG